MYFVAFVSMRNMDLCNSLVVPIVQIINITLKMVLSKTHVVNHLVYFIISTSTVLILVRYEGLGSSHWQSLSSAILIANTLHD